MRDEVMMDLVSRAMDDAEFRQQAQADLEGTLTAYGYELTEDELAAAREFHSGVAGMSDDELQRELTGSGGRRFGAG